MRKPLIVVTGVAPRAVESVTMSLSWDLPQAVVVRHAIDPVSQVLTRVVSDASGVVEGAEIPLEHACVGCALRDDILPTLERLARDARWNAIVSVLPIATEADQLGNALAWDARLARLLRLASVVTAVGADRPVDDMIGEKLLRERGLHSGPDDDRGVGEAACAQIEYADMLVFEEGPRDRLDASREEHAAAFDLARALAGPHAEFVTGTNQIDGALLADARHSHSRTTAWYSPTRAAALPPLPEGTRAWRLDLTSPRAFHPDRLLDQMEGLGGGRHRSRGCFWVPARPGLAAEWAGAGGQVSIGSHNPWGRQPRQTRLTFTGLGAAPLELAEAFEAALLTPAEVRTAGHGDTLEDGLEPWLGDIRDIA